MARDGGVSCLRSSEMMRVGIAGIESTPLDLDELHVLAVDDNGVDRIVIERLLRTTSCKVTAVDSGRRALELLGIDNEKDSAEFDRLKVDMIITDYCMPGMTGYDLLKKIKESSNFREVPVVIMSSENVLTRIDRCLEEGAEDFLLKPVKLDDVKRLTNHFTKDDKRKLQDDSFPIHDSLPPESPPLTISTESSDEDVLTSSSESSPTAEESPIRRQKIKSLALE